MAEKNYIGKAAERTTQYGKLFSMYLTKDKVIELLNKLDEKKNGIRLTMTEMKNKDQYGNTHTIFEDTYAPQSQGKKEETAYESSQENNIPESGIEDEDSGLPF